MPSHIPSEVDAACDRVGIVRAGRLVEVGPLDELRISQSRRVEIDFVGSPPDLSAIAGLTHLAVEGTGVRCQLSGSPSELLRAVAPHEVRSFTTRDADIEGAPRLLRRTMSPTSALVRLHARMLRRPTLVLTLLFFAASVAVVVGSAVLPRCSRDLRPARLHGA